ncbi:ANK REP REGION domain-containing protein [Citrus sinensis]|uniref:ANK REP REGION domain-containing protein n=2 Tax=Citrus sinensis TaxID=2711 RepID=A0ACB8IVB4_CITSI|nr:ANK REP REGION domain-containing protein [Citrus sinensis]
MEEAQGGQPKKKMTKQLTGKRDDTALHSAARAGNLDEVKDILTGTEEAKLKELLPKQNQSGETALYVAAEYGHVDLVAEMIKCYDLADAGIKARNGFDAFHIAAKEGHLEVLKVLLAVYPELAMTVDLTNTTALHTAAMQGHVEVLNFLIEAESSLITIARSNGKTALHSAARNGRLEVLKTLLAADSVIAIRTDKKGQTALHMAVKGQNIEVVEELIKAEPASVNMVDTKGNSPLHIATRKGREQIVRLLLANSETNLNGVNRTGETALDTAEKTGHSNLAALLREHGVESAKNMKPQNNPARELKQTVSDIKHEVHYQLEHTRQTRRRVHGIAKRLHKMHAEGLNNAINSTTVVAVLIATIAFAAIFQVPGQFVDKPEEAVGGVALGEAHVSQKPAFIIFFVFDSIALFISLAVVVVQTSVVVIESKAKRQLMAVINKLMWLACVLISVAYLAMSFIVVGKHEKWMAVAVTIVGAVIMAATLGTMIYWVIRHRIEDSNMRSIRKSSMGSRSKSGSINMMSDTEVLNNDYKKLYAI